MRQAFHIFKKDIRHLFPEITIVLVAVAAFTAAEMRQALSPGDAAAGHSQVAYLLTFLLPMEWWTLIARVIHAEALPGDCQFWTTRPYAWKSLLGAKALFILAFVNVPMLAAQAIILGANGFSPAAEILGMLWEQVVLTAVFVLPMAALSVLTTGFVQLLLTTLVVFVVFVLSTLISPGLGPYWGPEDWIRSSLDFLIIGASALAIVAWQYARRETAAARFTAVAAAILATLATALFPWTAGFAIQSRLSGQPVDARLLHVGFDSRRKWAVRALLDTGDEVRISLPLEVSGIPDAMDVKAEGLTVTIAGPGGVGWQARRQPWTYVASVGQLVTLQTTVAGSFYREVKDQPVTFRGALYFTLYGNHRQTRLTFGSGSVSMPGLGLCSASRGSDARMQFLFCKAAFRVRPASVGIRFLQAPRPGAPAGPRFYVAPVTFAPRVPVSYSPFPADLSFSPVTSYLAYASSQGLVEAVVIDSVEPLAHLRRDFEISGIRLADYEVAPGGRTSAPR